jgi:DNA-binding beta-propeller fold protein YncE
MLLCAALCVSLLASAPAFAASQRGHAFSFAFPGAGTGTEQLSHPSGVAVSSVTGDVYVADREKGRVAQFKPVLNAKGEPETEEFVAQFAVNHPEAVAVDNCASESKPCPGDPSAGDVYVAGAKKATETQDTLVYKFTATGAPVGTPLKLKSAIEGLAVDPAGNLFVYQSGGAITRFDNAEANAVTGRLQSGALGESMPGFAVDSEDNFYVGAVANKEEAPPGPLRELLKDLHTQGVDIIAKLANVAATKGTAPVLIHELSYENSTAVAVNPAKVGPNEVNEENEVYVTNSSTVAGEQVSTVAAFGPAARGPAEREEAEAHGEGKLIQDFGAPGLREADAIAVDPARGTVYVADAASNMIFVFGLEPSGKPVIDGLSANDLAPSGAVNATKLSAQLNPAGADTHYHFEYGPASCGASACTKTSSVDAGSAFGAQAASAEVQNLSPGTYYYRLIAENSFGTVASVERTFTIAATLSGLPDDRAWEMVSPPNKGGAEPEALTVEGGLIQAAQNGNAISYVADGPIPARTEPEGGRNPEFTQIFSVRSVEQHTWSSKDIATPNGTGLGPDPGVAPEYQFFSPNLALALVNPFPPAAGPFVHPPLSPLLPGETKGEQENTIYLRDNAPLQPEGSEVSNYNKAQENGKLMEIPNAGFLPLVTKANAPGPHFGQEVGRTQGLQLSGTSPDLSHVVFRSESTSPRGLFEWNGPEQELQPVGVLPNGTSEPEAFLGGAKRSQGSADVRHAVSSDGSLVFWTTYNGISATHLYIRDMLTKETLLLSEEGVEDHAVFQTASADGSKVFFTDAARLTSDSLASRESPDLYVDEFSTTGGHLSAKLTDLTASQRGGADVLVATQYEGGVLGASDDGNYVYFVADAALAPGATPGHCGNQEQEPVIRPAGTTCNLYVRHRNSTTGEWEPTRLVAALSFEDLPDWGGLNRGLGYTTSRVSPNGRYLTFMSNRSLTGYNNVDVQSGHADEEVFLYDATTARLVCASCNPSGAQPAGVFDTGPTVAGEHPEGLGLVVDRPGVWAAISGAASDHWLAASVPGWTVLDSGARALYQSRYLSDSGRLFFNSPDHLVPGATGGKEKVYEYDPNEVGACHQSGGCIGLISPGTSTHEAAFLDASATGNDVFFLTADQLSSQDVDSNFDIYDAHVCENASPCPPPEEPPAPPCQGEACQGSFSPGPSFSTPASTSSSGVGNLVPQVQVLAHVEAAKPTPKPLTRAQKLAKALKSCRKYKSKHKRVACEKLAKKKYGPIKASAKKTTTKGHAR